jgi:hypothetical protein
MLPAQPGRHCHSVGSAAFVHVCEASALFYSCEHCLMIQTGSGHATVAERVILRAQCLRPSQGCVYGIARKQQMVVDVIEQVPYLLVWPQLMTKHTCAHVG